MDVTFEYRQNIFISFLSDGTVQHRDTGNAYDVGVDMNSLVLKMKIISHTSKSVHELLSQL